MIVKKRRTVNAWWTNAWMHDQMIEWLIDWLNEWIKEGRKEGRAWMDGWTNDCVNEWMHACMDGWMHGWMEGWTNERSNGWMDEWRKSWGETNKQDLNKGQHKWVVKPLDRYIHVSHSCHIWTKYKHYIMRITWASLQKWWLWRWWKRCTKFPAQPPRAESRLGVRLYFWSLLFSMSCSEEWV